MTDQLTFVAVYGSLRMGMHNSRLLATSQHLGTERIKGFDMYSLGAYPFIAPSDSNNEITIEVYAVDVLTMKRLDMLEGYPSFYNRMQVPTSHGDAWIYFIEDKQGRTPVPDGDWVKFCTGT